MERQKIFLDIGAGRGEQFIKRAKVNPKQQFLIVEPDFRNIPVKEVLPPNLQWVTGKVGIDSFLPLANETVNEANLDFVFSFVRGDSKSDEEYLRKARQILAEAMRVVKEKGKVYIREPREEITELRTILEGLSVKEKPMNDETAYFYSESARDTILEFWAGDEGAQPVELEIRK